MKTAGFHPRALALAGAVALLGGCRCADEPEPFDPAAARAELVSAIFSAQDPVELAEACRRIAAQTGAKLGRDVDRTACFAALRAAVEARFELRVRRGAVRSLRLELEVPRSALENGATTDDVAVGLLRAFPVVLGLDDPARELRLRRRIGASAETLELRQYVADLPVFGSWLSIDVEPRPDRFLVRRLAGKYVSRPELPALDPELSAGAAIARALSARGVSTATAARVFGPPRLWVFDPALLAPDCWSAPARCPEVPSAPRLAWRLALTSRADRGVVADVFVDARTGEVLYDQARSDAWDLRLFTASSHSSETCFVADVRRGVDPWFDEDGVCESWVTPCWGSNHCAWGRLAMCAEPDAEGDTADHVARVVHRFFRDEIGTDADLGDEGPYKIYLDACVAGEACPMDNAYAVDCWGAADLHLFGDGMVDLDIVAHEAGHTHHRTEANYVYQNQSGAIAEHVADLFGHFVSCWSGEDCDFVLGEHSAWAASGCPRDLADPGVCGHPAHMDDYVVTTTDHGGAHSNCGIPNKAAHLLIAGGVHPHSGVSVEGLGEDKARAIHKGVVEGLPENPDLDDLAERARLVCDRLVGTPLGVSTHDCCQVTNAYVAVGIGFPDSDCDGTIDLGDTDDDADGVLDHDDTCPLLPDPDQSDVDGDGDGDDCDPDADGDGRPNESDNCPLLAGPTTDTDGDGLGDICEDTDGDGVVDGVDNCPGNANPDQGDLDGDGDGDRCDPDRDDDGIDDDGDDSGRAGDHPCTGGATADCDDNCRFLRNPAQIDLDGDGIGSSCDVCAAVPDPEQRDGDGDGRGDACDPDRDDDGVPNEQDLCPDLPGEGAGDLVFCPPETICRRGCPYTRLLEPETRVRMEIGARVLPANDPFFPMAELPFDLCAFVPCEDEELLDPATRLGVKVAVAADLPRGLAMEVPIELGLALLDEAGRRQDSAALALFSRGDTYQGAGEVELFLGPAPSFAMRASGSILDVRPPAAAVPSVRLLVFASPGDLANRALFADLPVELTLQSGALPPDAGVPDGGPDAGDGGADAGVDAGDGGAPGFFELAECTARGLEDLFEIMARLRERIAEIDVGSAQLPERFTAPIDLDDDGQPDGVLTATLAAGLGTDATDGLSPGEVIAVRWRVTSGPSEPARGAFSFPKLSADTFRVTIFETPDIRTHPGCGAVLLTSFGLHLDVHDPDLRQAYGMLEFEAHAGQESLTGLLGFGRGAEYATATGTYDGASYELYLDLLTFEWIVK